MYKNYWKEKKAKLGKAIVKNEPRPIWWRRIFCDHAVTGAMFTSLHNNVTECLYCKKILVEKIK